MGALSTSDEYTDEQKAALLRVYQAAAVLVMASVRPPENPSPVGPQSDDESAPQAFLREIQQEAGLGTLGQAPEEENAIGTLGNGTFRLARTAG